MGPEISMQTMNKPKIRAWSSKNLAKGPKNPEAEILALKKFLYIIRVNLPPLPEGRWSNVKHRI